MTPTAAFAPLTDADIEQLQTLLDAVPEPLQALDTMALDGYLCGVLLQPQPVPTARWLQFVTDIDDGHALPPAFAGTAALQSLVLRRHAELDQALGDRQWFDPWIYPLEDGDNDSNGDGGDDTDSDSASAGDSDDAAPSATVLPWVAGFAAAMDLFPALMRTDDPALIEPLALLYRHFDPDDLEDADALLAVIETLEPPADLAEAVQDLVRSLMLIADVTRPRPAAAPPARRATPARAAKKAARPARR